jgi:hypothetical protein
MYDMTNVTYIRRITIGSTNPEKMTNEEDAKTALDFLNRCLTDLPKGKILGIEKTFSILNIGEHQVVLQAMIYHVGFPRRPTWLPADQT